MLLAKKLLATKMLGNSYAVEYLGIVIDQDIPSLPKSIKNRIKTAIEEKLAVNPIVFGKPLQHSLKGHRRLRVGDYRIVFRIDEKHRKVIIVAIKHRKKIYES